MRLHRSLREDPCVMKIFFSLVRSFAGIVAHEKAGLVRVLQGRCTRAKRPVRIEEITMGRRQPTQGAWLLLLFVILLFPIGGIRIEGGGIPIPFHVEFSRKV
jgi:hypothetical protein